MPQTCPACVGLVEDTDRSCPTCGLNLGLESFTPDLRRSGDFVILAYFDNLVKAQILEGRLKADGIPAMITGEEDATFGMNNPGSMAPTRVVVPAELAAEALRVLAQDGQWTEEELTRYLSMLEDAPDQ